MTSSAGSSISYLDLCPALSCCSSDLNMQAAPPGSERRYKVGKMAIRTRWFDDQIEAALGMPVTGKLRPRNGVSSWVDCQTASPAVLEVPCIPWRAPRVQPPSLPCCGRRAPRPASTCPLMCGRTPVGTSPAS